MANYYEIDDPIDISHSYDDENPILYPLYHDYAFDFNTSGDFLAELEDPNHGFHTVLAHIMMIVIYPIIMAASLLLIVMLFRSKLIRGQPWRWLIAHTCFSIFIAAFLMFMSGMTSVFRLPSLETTPVCQAVRLMEGLSWQMYAISITLVLIERFSALTKDDWKAGGMGKKTVIISLVIFWILDVLAHIMVVFVAPDFELFPVREFPPGIMTCSMMHNMINSIFQTIIALWSLISTIIVIIGCSIYACRKTDAERMKSAIIPTLVIGVIHLFAYLLPFFVDLMHMEGLFPWMPNLEVTMYLLSQLTWIPFSLTWLITWKKNGDINYKDSCRCCHRNTDEEFQLLETTN